MTDETKTKVKQRVWGGSKIVAVLGALVTALYGYTDAVNKLELSVRINGMKMNALAAKVAYMEGRFDGMTMVEAKAAVVDKIEAMPEMDPVAFVEEGILVPANEFPEPVSSDPDPEFETVVSVEASPEPPPERIKVVKKITDLAYQDVPTSLDDLEQFQEQLQIQDGE